MTDKQYIELLEKQLAKQPPSDRQVFVNSMNKLAKKGKKKAAPRRKKTGAEKEFLRIIAFAIIAFAVGYYYLTEWGLIHN